MRRMTLLWPVWMFLFTMLSPLCVTHVTALTACVTAPSGSGQLTTLPYDVTPAWSEPSHRRRGLTILLSYWSLRCRQPPSLANSRQPSVGAKVRLCARRDLGNFSKMRIVKKEIISGPPCVSVPFVYSYVTLSVSEVD